MSLEGTVVHLMALYHPVFDQRWHTVAIYRNDLELILDVDGYRNKTQLGVALGVAFNGASFGTYFGGPSYTPNHLSITTGFVGLLNVTVDISGENVHLINDAINGSNIDEYKAGTCTPDTCSNGGLCQDNGMGFVCTCPLGFGGVDCDEGN